MQRKIIHDSVTEVKEIASREMNCDKKELRTQVMDWVKEGDYVEWFRKPAYRIKGSRKKR